MHWIKSAYTLILLLSGFATAILIVISWSQRKKPFLFYFILLLSALTEWTVFAFLEVISSEVPVKIVCSQLEYLGVATTPSFFLFFVLSYSHLDRWLTRRNLILLAIIPALTIGIAATNNQYFWLWSSYSLNTSTNIITYGHGPWFWVNVIYSYLLVIGANGLLIWDLFRFPRIYRRQIRSLLIASFIPWIANAIYIFKALPISSLDWTSVGFSFSSIIFFLVIFRYQIFELLPIGREAVFDSMGDGAIIVDDLDRIVDLNSTARNSLNMVEQNVVGQPVESLLIHFPEILEAIQEKNQAEMEIELKTQPKKFLDLRIFPLLDWRRKLSGKAILFRDITERKRADQLLEEALDLNQKIVSASSVGILLYKSSGECILVNDASTLIIHATQEVLLRQNYREIQSWKESGLLVLAEKALKSNYSQRGEVHHFSTFGQDLWLDSYFIPLTMNNEPHLLLLIIDITERKHFEQAEHEQRLLAEALRDTAEVLNSSFNLDKILDRVLSNIGQVISFEAAEVFLFDIEGEVQIARLRSHNAPAPNEENENLGILNSKFGILTKVRETGQVLIIPDVIQNADWSSSPGFEWVRSYISVPMIVKGKIIGAISLSSQLAQFYNSTHEKQLLAFANAAAVAIENARLYAEVQRLAITDELTGIYNYRALMELGPREVERAHRFGRPLCGLFIDIDHFRDFNNRYSHTIGNMVLKMVSKTLVNGVRAMDLVARYGGEEFIVLLTETDIEATIQISERLCSEIEKATLPTEWGPLSVRISIGAAALEPDMQDLSTLINHANRAEHKAKKQGGNCVVMYQEE
jgi:diguanylate cyclase (GGDEF)-like protein